MTRPLPADSLNPAHTFDATAASDGGALKPLPLDVVSVQSLVVYGCVGNNVAWPTLHEAGLEVAVVPSVFFSNTPHYPSIHGGPIPTDWFQGYLDDLLARGALDHLQAVLVGYLGSPEQTACLETWINTLRTRRPSLQVIVDPVIGDEDSGVYVAPGMAEATKHRLLPVATGLTPNGFELGCLTGLPVNTVDEVFAAARTLLTGTVQWVVVTSAAPNDAGISGEGTKAGASTGTGADAGRTTSAGSDADAASAEERAIANAGAGGSQRRMQVAIVTRDGARIHRHARVDSCVKGTGDLFSATLTARLLSGDDLDAAVQTAAERVTAALHLTAERRSAELILGS